MEHTLSGMDNSFQYTRTIMIRCFTKKGKNTALLSNGDCPYIPRFQQKNTQHNTVHGNRCRYICIHGCWLCVRRTISLMCLHFHIHFGLLFSRFVKAQRCGPNHEQHIPVVYRFNSRRRVSFGLEREKKGKHIQQYQGLRYKVIENSKGFLTRIQSAECRIYWKYQFHFVFDLSVLIAIAIDLLGRLRCLHKLIFLCLPFYLSTG